MTSPAVDTGIVAFIKARCHDIDAAFEAAVETEAAYLRSDGLPETTAQEVKTFWLTEGHHGWWPRTIAFTAMRRAILALHDGQRVPFEGWMACIECLEPYPCQTVRLLAAIDADHPDFDPSWKPVAG